VFVTQAAAPRVFIGYSHDSEAHRDRVLDLADRLRADHVDAWIDQSHFGFLVVPCIWIEFSGAGILPAMPPKVATIAAVLPSFGAVPTMSAGGRDARPTY
jgi:hypothetical protein